MDEVIFETESILGDVLQIGAQLQTKTGNLSQFFVPPFVNKMADRLREVDTDACIFVEGVRSKIIQSAAVKNNRLTGTFKDEDIQSVYSTQIVSHLVEGYQQLHKRHTDTEA